MNPCKRKMRKKQKDIMAFYLQLLKLRQLKQKDRIQRHMEKVEELLKSMRCEGKIKQVTRLGKRTEKVAQERKVEDVKDTNLDL